MCRICNCGNERKWLGYCREDSSNNNSKYFYTSHQSFFCSIHTKKSLKKITNENKKCFIQHQNCKNLQLIRYYFIKWKFSFSIELPSVQQRFLCSPSCNLKTFQRFLAFLSHVVSNFYLLSKRGENLCWSVCDRRCQPMLFNGSSRVILTNRLSRAVVSANEDDFWCCCTSVGDVWREFYVCFCEGYGRIDYDSKQRWILVPLYMFRWVCCAFYIKFCCRKIMKGLIENSAILELELVGTFCNLSTCACWASCAATRLVCNNSLSVQQLAQCKATRRVCSN